MYSVDCEPHPPPWIEATTLNMRGGFNQFERGCLAGNMHMHMHMYMYMYMYHNCSSYTFKGMKFIDDIMTLCTTLVHVGVIDQASCTSCFSLSPPSPLCCHGNLHSLFC